MHIHKQSAYYVSFSTAWTAWMYGICCLNYTFYLLSYALLKQAT